MDFGGFVLGNREEGARTMDGTRMCSAEDCENEAVTRFVERDLCLNHFVSRCYADLARLDPRGRNGDGSQAESSKLKEFAEECSQRALEISLSGCVADNLQRGRLLDILLWAGEILPMESERARVTAC